MAIDPKDGKVANRVVSRNLPFVKRVRGRIFVHGPRMSGTIGVNEKATHLIDQVLPAREAVGIPAQ